MNGANVRVEAFSAIYTCIRGNGKWKIPQQSHVSYAKDTLLEIRLLSLGLKSLRIHIVITRDSTAAAFIQ